MEFIVHYKVHAGQRETAQARFSSTGAPPPDGVTMTNRWHCVHGGEGYLHCQSDDAAAIATWIQQWSDVLDFQVTPVVGDETMAGIIGG